ncbi:HAD-IIB family hydrolase, partial [Staphylococcus arlettae]
DVDGTICFNGRFIETELYNEIKRIDSKHQIIFASARPIRDLVPVIKGFEDKILVGGNGSIVSNNNEVSVIKSISENAFEVIKKLILENDLEFIIDGSFDYSAKVSPNNKIYRQLDPDYLAKNVKMEDISEPIKIILINLKGYMFDYVKTVLEEYDEFLSINYHKNENNIDITAKNINKYTTLKKIINTDNYIAYGNDINDYELLKHAKKAYYVGDKKKDIPFANVESINSDSHAVADSLKLY